MVVLVIGKANAGKTTLGEKLRIVSGGVHLDSDAIRKIWPCGFEEKDREEHLLRMGKLGVLFEEQKKLVIISAMVPKKKWRNMMKNKFNQSYTIYLPYGELWEGTEYEEPSNDEISFYYDWRKDDFIWIWEELQKKLK